VVAISDIILIATPLYLTRHTRHDRALYGRLAAVFVMSGSTTLAFVATGVLVLMGGGQGALMAGLIEVRSSLSDWLFNALISFLS
jgi:SAM-dependent MidA family methyltransferase